MALGSGGSSASGENENDLGAGRAPTVQHGGIGERKGDIPRDRDALAERAQRLRRRAVQPQPEWPGDPAQPRQVHMLGHQRRGPIEEIIQLGQFVRLDQPQVAFGQFEPGIVRQAAEDRLGKAVVAGAAQQRLHDSRCPPG